MIHTHPLPRHVEAQVKRVLGTGEKIRFHLATDMTDALEFGERWLVVTDKRVIVAPWPGGKNGHGVTYFEHPIKAIESCEVQPIVGGGMLVAKARRKGPTTVFVHYSNSLSARFAEAAKGITQLAKGRKLELSQDLKSDRCPRCGRLLPDPNERCPFCVKYLQAMGRILQYLRPYAGKALFAISLTATGTILQLVPPQVTRTVIDYALKTHEIGLLSTDAPSVLADIHTQGIWGVLWTSGLVGFLRAFGIMGLVGTLLAVNVLGTAILVYNNTQLSWLGGRVGTDIRTQIFQAIEKLNMKFFDRRHVGHIMSRVMSDSDRLQGFLIEGFPFLAQNALLLGGIIFLLMRMSVTLTLLIMIPVPIMFLGQYLFWKYVRALSHKAWNQQSLLNNRLHESVSGVRVVKAFSQEGREVTRFEKQNDKWFVSQYAVDKFWGMFSPGMQFFVTSGVLIVWYVGGKNVSASVMSLGTLMAYINYLWLFYGPLQWFNQVNNWMTRAFAGAERIFETIDTTPESYEPAKARPMPVMKGSIEFRNVTFSYEKGKPALKEVSFKIRPGEMIGLVGKSGSGKSTLLSLLCRFYEPDEGVILVDGVPLDKIRLADLRKNIGLVLQEPFLFGTSIFDNIAYSNPNATFDDVIESARAANAHEFIMGKNDAYDTRVGERGNRLSGGEKQRISIARAILHDPRILILDEATSSVDSETESKIQQALDRLVHNRTTLVAAHRLSTLRNADRIFVMEEGKLAEVGSHTALIARGGIYSRLVRAQEEAWRKAKKNLSIAQ